MFNCRQQDLIYNKMKKIEKDKSNLIINDYTINYLSNSKLAIKYNLHRGTIQRILIENNIKLRKKTPNINVNHHYFSKYNDDNCYWAGFILADGHIRSNRRNTLIIKLKISDSPHLEKFKTAINFGGRIIKKTTYCSITISSPQIIKDLENNFDIKTKKSLTCYISDNIPLMYLKHYIRGYFDGDGSISKKTMNINFLGTYKTVNFIRNYFFDYCKIKLRSKNLPDVSKNKNIHVISYSGKTAYKCLNHLYEKSKYYLDRKYLLYYNSL